MDDTRLELLRSFPEDYGGSKNIFRWNYFYTPVQIGDATLGVRIAVRDISRGASMNPESQIYNWNIKKETPLDGGRRGQKVASSGISSDASSQTDIVSDSLTDAGTHPPQGLPEQRPFTGDIIAQDGADVNKEKEGGSNQPRAGKNRRRGIDGTTLYEDNITQNSDSVNKKGSTLNQVLSLPDSPASSVTSETKLEMLSTPFNEMDIVSNSRTDAGTHPPQGLPEQRPFTSDIIAQDGADVNKEAKNITLEATAGIPTDAHTPEASKPVFSAEPQDLPADGPKIQSGEADTVVNPVVNNTLSQSGQDVNTKTRATDRSSTSHAPDGARLVDISRPAAAPVDTKISQNTTNVNSPAAIQQRYPNTAARAESAKKQQLRSAITRAWWTIDDLQSMGELTQWEAKKLEAAQPFLKNTHQKRRQQKSCLLWRSFFIMPFACM